MSSVRFDSKRIAIKNLLLWDRNSRIPEYLFGEKESEIIQELIERYDLLNFANEVVKDFDLPQLEKIVVVQRRSNMVVFEGNRRIATYKCLANPSLVKDPMIRNKFQSLGEQIGIRDSFSLDCIVTNSQKAAMRYVKRKHYNRNNEIAWSQFERDNYINRTVGPKDGLSKKETDSIYKVNLGNKVQIIDLPEDFKRKILGKGLVTLFYRVVDSNSARKKLKYSKTQDHDVFVANENIFSSLLKVIVYNIVNKKTFSGDPLNSRTLNKEEDINNYLSSISVDNVTRIDTLIEQNKESKKSSSKTKSRKPGKVQTYALVPFVFEKGYTLPYGVKSKKIKNTFKELEKLDVQTCPQAVSIMIRILIEVSVQEYLTNKGAPQKIGEQVDLASKIIYIKDQYIKDKNLKELIVILIKEKLLTKKLNQVAHNTIFNATETMTRDIWTHTEPFFAFLVK
jgi:hypothetical protein